MLRWVIATLLVLSVEFGYSSAPASAVRSSTVTQTGLATYVTQRRDGGQSASGEIFQSRQLVAAHRTLPWGSIVRVVNLRNSRAVTVRVIDRGPYGRNARHGAIVDLSRAAARRLRMIQDGKVLVHLIVVRLGPGTRVRRQVG